VSSLFDRVAAKLFGASTPAVAAEDRELVDDLVEAFVDTVEPRVRLRSGYRDRLAPNVMRSIAHLRRFGQAPLEPRLLTRAAWSADPLVRAAFAAAEDVPAFLGRSDLLREFFKDHPDCDEAHALLGMQREEKTVLAPREENGVLRNEVAQTVVGFTGHRLLAPRPDHAALRLEIGRRIMQRLAQQVLARVTQIDQRAEDLAEDKARLGVRLRMLKSARDGMHALAGADRDIGAEILALEAELKQVTAERTEARASLATLDRYIDHMNAVLGHPEQHVELTLVPRRLNRMNVVVPDGSPEEATPLEFTELSIGDGLRATIVPVRIPRAELPPEEDLATRARRAL
jgi:hypothetical protein